MCFLLGTESSWIWSALFLILVVMGVLNFVSRIRILEVMVVGLFLEVQATVVEMCSCFMAQRIGESAHRRKLKNITRKEEGEEEEEEGEERKRRTRKEERVLIVLMCDQVSNLASMLSNFQHITNRRVENEQHFLWSGTNLASSISSFFSFAVILFLGRN